MNREQVEVKLLPDKNNHVKPNSDIEIISLDKSNDADNKNKHYQEKK